MVVVAAVSLGGVKGPRRCEPRSAVDDVGLPLTVVDEGVVGSTEQSGVVEVGFSAFLPRDYMVGFTPCGGCPAVREGAAEVSSEEEFALSRCEEAVAAADIDDFLSGAVSDVGYFGIAQRLAEQT